MKVLSTLVEIDGKVRTVSIPSATRKGLVHRVVLACTCESFTFNGYCRHLSEASAQARDESVAAAAYHKDRIRKAQENL